jgi:hypothetical protein
MIEFDLQKAKKGVPVRTRDGRKAIFNAHLDGGQPAPLLFDIGDLYEADEDEFEDDPSRVGNLENYYLDGRHETVHDSPLDLFMEY